MSATMCPTKTATMSSSVNGIKTCRGHSRAQCRRQCARHYFIHSHSKTLSATQFIWLFEKMRSKYYDVTKTLSRTLSSSVNGLICLHVIILKDIVADKNLVADNVFKNETFGSSRHCWRQCFCVGYNVFKCEWLHRLYSKHLARHCARHCRRHSRAHYRRQCSHGP